jgi:ferredoxin
MVVLFGTSTVDETLGEGHFVCPSCRVVTPYTHSSRRRVFHLFFIPLIPLQKLDDCVECGRCRQLFTSSALSTAVSPEQVKQLERKTEYDGKLERELEDFDA